MIIKIILIKRKKMNLLKSSFIAVNLCALLSLSLSAQTFSIQNKTLIEAIKEISKNANIPYLANSTLLENKKAPNIKNIEGLENALKKVLQGTNLEAVIEDGTILIRKKTIKSNSSSHIGSIDVIERSNITEGSKSYTIGSMSTATKMNLSIKETPQSVSVITREQINDLNITSIADIVRASTGLYAESINTDISNYYARGFSIKNFQINGVPTNLKTGYKGDTYQDLGIYDRVEVVRGSTGLLSGSGEPSATINFVRKKANSKEFKGQIDLEVGSWNKKKASVDLSSALNAKGSIRTRIFASKENKEAAQDFYEKDTNVFYSLFEADITDNTLLSLGFSYQQDDAKGVTYGEIPALFSDGSKTDFDVSKTTSSPWTFRKTTQKRYFASLEHTFMNDIKINTSYAHAIIDTTAKLARLTGTVNKTTGLGLTSKANYYPSDKVTQDTLDVYANIPFEAFSNEHEIIAGFSYSKMKTNTDSITGTNSAANSFYTWNGATEPTWGSASNKTQEVSESGIYTAARINVSNDLKLIFGSRLSNYSYNENNAGIKKSREDKNVITPYAGIVYNINDTYSAYASYTNIFTPQSKKTKNGDTLQPIRGNSIEVGTKASYFDDKLNASLSIYKMQQENIAKRDQGQTVLLTSENAYTESKGTMSRGIEFEVAGDITENLNLSIGMSKNTTKYSDGSKDEYTPDRLLKIYAKYNINKLTLGTGLNWQSDRKDGVEQASYAIISAMSKYDFTNDLSLQVNVTNLFDKKYYSTFWVNGYNYGEARKITAKLSYKF